MTAHRDPDRLIHHFLLEGAEQLQDQVYDAVRADIEQRRQRGRFGPWRMPTMNKLVPIGLGAAAVVVALVVGTQLLGIPAPSGPVAAPSAALSPTAEPSVAAPSRTPEGLLPEGSHVLRTGAVPMTITISAPDWYGEPGGAIVVKDDNPDPPDGAGMIVFVGNDDLYVYGDPCKWSTTRPDNPSTTVDAFVAAMTAQASREASESVDISVNGYTGKSITVHVPDGANFAACDQATFGSWGQGLGDPDRFHQGPGQIDKLWILDVDGASWSWMRRTTREPRRSSSTRWTPSSTR